MTRIARLTLVWLSLVAVANGIQGLVLCTGGHGHVLIKAASHHHCSNTAHDHDGGIGVYLGQGASEADHDHCEPCVDIPLFWGSVSTDVVSTSDGAHGTTSVIQYVLATLPGDGYIAAPASYHPLAAFHVPLSSIVLQV